MTKNILPSKQDKDNPHQVKAKKSLGQNFLQDESVLRDASEALEIEKTDTVIEIGPGHGELTNYLLKKDPKELILIEKDNSLAQKLIGSLAKTNKNIQVIEGDALTTLPNLFNELSNPASLASRHRAIKIIGNIPYYITGQLFRVIGELENKPKLIVLMIQKEVAERVCAKQGKMNLLSASVQIWADCEIIRLVSREAFHPKPKVDSAIIKITPKQGLVDNKEMLENYYKLIKVLFKQPRKTVWNNLRDTNLSKEDLKNVGINPTDRPQELGVDEMIRLC